MKYDELDIDLQLDLAAAYELMFNEGASEDEIKTSLDDAMKTALPDSEVIDRRLIIEELMQQGNYGAAEEPPTGSDMIDAFAGTAIEKMIEEDDSDYEVDDYLLLIDGKIREVSGNTEMDVLEKEKPDSYHIIKITGVEPYKIETVESVEETTEEDQDESDSDVLDRYLGEGNPDQLNKDEMDILISRNGYDEMTDSEKAEAILVIVADREDEDEDEEPPFIPQMMPDEQVLIDILGADLVASLEGAGYSIDVERVDSAAAILFYDNNRNTRIIQMIDSVESTMDADGNPVYRPTFGEEITNTANILTDSIDVGLNLSKIINQISTSTAPEIEDAKIRRRISNHLTHLTRVQDAQNNLSEVFGFDDPRELEAFMSAWLMKNSTCRLSGIPGTGKTTVINSAAVVMANSYGFTSHPRFYPRTKNTTVVDPRTGAETIKQVADRNSRRFIFPQGMSYDVTFSARGSTDSLSAWDSWRFSDWDRQDYSGAYAYDFEFLRSSGKVGPLSADDFVRILFMYHRPSVINPEKYPASDIADVVNRYAMPITITINKSGSLTIDAPAGGKDEETKISFTYQTSSPNGDDLIKSRLEVIAPILLRDNSQEDLIGEDGSIKLRTDTGFAEGALLRQILMKYFYDSRVSKTGGDYSGDALESLRSEMLQEIGVAKIDNDKRADEILYGMEIQQVRENKEGRDVQTFVFDPIPRPIVTQPIKFFNEANRSQAGVEDAVLGLIAEREVEYRGKTFNSPAFVAWMDTNPHQKANDLAFTDRIDTELFFGTISLGARNSQLQTRYAGAKNAKPDIQLITRIIESKIDNPLRIGDLGLGRQSVWRFIDGIPFRPPEVTSGYDGLRDIATLSVLFTQRPQLRSPPSATGASTQFGIQYNIERTFTDYESTNPHASPLEDISRASVSEIIDGMDTARQIHEGEATFQPQSRIKRVLGFRFTDSIVKMSRALAFLRGKTYVGRREIVDSLPYCLGHRLGKARAEGDQEPTGIDQTEIGSEQAYVRQILVHGYLMNDTGTGSPGGMTAGTGGATDPVGAFEMWDAYFAYCSQKLASAISYAEFESSVLQPLQIAYVNASENLTTVHWHLATSVVETERTGITNMHPSHYTLVCTNGRTHEGGYSYPDVLAHYRKMISRPEKPNDASTPVAMTYNFAAADYFMVRGRIASDRFLFSDDKAHLLDLVDSRIDSLCGRDTGVGIVSSLSAIASKSNSYGVVEAYTVDRDWIPYGTDPRTFPWRSYGDSAGAWGQILGTARDFDIPSAATATADLDLGSSDRALLFSLADQSHRIIIQAYEMGDAKAPNFKDGDDRMKASEQEYRFRKHQAPQLIEQFQDFVGNGVMFAWDNNNLRSVPVGIPVTGTGMDANVSNRIPEIGFAEHMRSEEIKANVPVQLENLIKSLDAVISLRMTSGSNKTIASRLLSNGGIMACFPLRHAPGVVDRAASTGAIPKIFDLLKIDSAEDSVEERFGDLRMWIRLHEESSGSNEYTNLVFSFGITSNLARLASEQEEVEQDGGTITTQEKLTLQYLDINDLAAYNRESFTTAAGIIDAGNLTAEDVVTFDRLFSKALNTRTD
jgi:hypothetical protein